MLIYDLIAQIFLEINKSIKNINYLLILKNNYKKYLSIY